MTTTINQPTEAIEKFDLNNEWTLVVVGDLKTPSNYKLKNGIYLSPEEQIKINPELSDAIGWNCIQRRNMGFLFALMQGAEIIASVDDDNIPTVNWGKNLIIGTNQNINTYSANSGLFDPISVTNYPHLWHRGYPIQYLNQRNYFLTGTEKILVDIEASFWNGDPDIDAICRMEHSPECNFDTDVFPFTSNGISPFNSQNTFITSSALKQYFMFPNIGRMDDIWASFYLQAIGKRVVYTSPTVQQVRNPHDLTIDFEREILGYLNNYKLLPDILLNPNNLKNYVGDKSWNAFQIYLRAAGAL